MSAKYPENNRNDHRRPPQNDAARRRAAQAARAKKRKEYLIIRIATILIALLLIAVIIVSVVSCTRKKSAPGGSSQAEPVSVETESNASAVLKKSDIPTEYIAPSVWHDEIEVTDEYPVQGSDSSYSIHVNTALNAVTVYDADGTPLRVMTCSTGRRDGHETPEGTFYLGEWIIDWCYMADGTEGLHAYRIIDNINNDIMFHSVPYYSANRGDLETAEYNKLGDYASMGCIRMCVADCRWLGQLCATGTEVVIYYDENEQLPMEKPAPIRIPEDIEEVRGWDPTDPISENPWHSYAISMEAPNSVTIAKNTASVQDSLLAAVTAADNYGNDLSGYLTCSEVPDSSQAGIYTVRLSCDVGPAHAYKDVYVVVE